MGESFQDYSWLWSRALTKTSCYNVFSLIPVHCFMTLNIEECHTTVYVSHHLMKMFRMKLLAIKKSLLSVKCLGGQITKW